jgi:hypothetical protein
MSPTRVPDQIGDSPADYAYARRGPSHFRPQSTPSPISRRFDQKQEDFPLREVGRVLPPRSSLAKEHVALSTLAKQL